MVSDKVNKMIHILWLVDHLGYDGVMHGAGKYYLNTIPFFNKSEFNIVLLVIRKKDQLTDYFTDKGITVDHLGRSKYDPRALFDIIKVVKSLNISLIHTHGYGADNFGRAAGFLLRIPTIVHSHDENSNYPFHQYLADLLFKRFTKKTIAVSESVKESCVKKRNMSRDRIFVIHNGIPINELINPEEEQIQKEKKNYNINPDAKVIGTVARLREEKGVKFIIKSMPKILDVFPNIILYIAGDGPLRQELENLSKDIGVGNKVIFTGFQRDIAKVLSVIDIFVASSLTEGFGLVVVEAMAMAKPIVATKVGGILEILKDGETGLFIPPKDPESLAEKIIYLLQNEEKARYLGEKAKEESKRYDINNYVEKLGKSYLELMMSKQ